MQQRIRGLETVLSPDDRIELVMLNNAFVAATKKSKENATPASVRDWRRAREDLENMIDILEDKYLKADAPGTDHPAEPVWEGFVDTGVQYDVLRWLQETGWAVKKQTFYNHCKGGKLKKNGKGLYTRRAVKKYAESWLVHHGLGTTVAEDTENLVRDKMRTEIRRIETAEEAERFKLEVLKGRHIERSKVELELSSRLVVLDHGLEYLFKTHLAEMVALVGGDADKGPLLLDLLLRKKDEQLSRFANMDDFTVVFDEE